MVQNHTPPEDSFPAGNFLADNFPVDSFPEDSYSAGNCLAGNWREDSLRDWDKNPAFDTHHYTRPGPTDSRARTGHQDWHMPTTFHKIEPSCNPPALMSCNAHNSPLPALFCKAFRSPGRPGY